MYEWPSISASSPPFDIVTIFFNFRHSNSCTLRSLIFIVWISHNFVSFRAWVCFILLRALYLLNILRYYLFSEYFYQLIFLKTFLAYGSVKFLDNQICPFLCKFFHFFYIKKFVLYWEINYSPIYSFLSLWVFFTLVLLLHLEVFLVYSLRIYHESFAM